jgi:hypothetical protein
VPARHPPKAHPAAAKAGDRDPELSGDEAAALAEAEERAADQEKHGWGMPLEELSESQQQARQEHVTRVAREAGLSGEDL